MKQQSWDYHFRETIVDGAGRFDYKIHAGPSISRNAIKLLELLGYPQSITTNLNGMAQHFTDSRKWGIVEVSNEFHKS